MASINYDDKRFQDVENDKNQALDEVNNVYGDMIKDSDKYYQDQIDAIKDYGKTQEDIQNEQTDFIIDKVEQQKEWAEKDYTKEQKGAYADWQNASNQYGANAEAMATQGMSNTGFSESSQVSMYNEYQNRVATARESYNRAVVDYDMAIKEARLQNKSVLADIAFKTLQSQLELSLKGFEYKNNLLLQQLNAKNQTEDRYYSRWQNVQQQINTENAMAEQIRQYNENMKFQQDKAKQDQSNWERQFAYAKEQDAIKNAGIIKDGNSGGGGKGGVTGSAIGSNAKNQSTIKQDDTPSNTKKDKGNGPKYNDVLKTARLTYGYGIGGNQAGKRNFVEDYLARSVNSGDITLAGAEKILKTIGIK